MKAKIIFALPDRDAIEQAEKLGMPEPKSVERPGDIYFNIEYIHLAYLNEDKDIVIYLPSGHWILERDEKTWTDIQKYLMDNR